MSQDIEARPPDASPSEGANAPRPTRRRWKLYALIVISLVPVEAVIVALVYRTERSALDRDARKAVPVTGGKPYIPPFLPAWNTPLIRRPPTRPASEARLGDDEPVFGVRLGGRYRAYKVAPFNTLTQHVVNDVLGGSAVTVTYCDLTRCVHAFTAEGRREPLDLEAWGLIKGRMAIRIAGNTVPYDQESGERMDSKTGGGRLPYDTLPVEQTTWGLWKAAHPQTDVYEGP